MQPEVPGLRIMEEGILVPQWQTLLLLLPPGDLETCCCLHQITVTRVFCLTSNLQSLWESFLGCPGGVLTIVCPVTTLPKSQCIAAHRLSILLYHCSSPSCAPHQYGEKLLPTVFRHKKPILGRLCHPSPLQFNSPNEACSEPCQGLPPLTHPVSLKVICKLLSTLTSCLIIPNPLC